MKSRIFLLLTLMAVFFGIGFCAKAAQNVLLRGSITCFMKTGPIHAQRAGLT